MVKKSASLARPFGWRGWVCGVAIVGASLGVAGASGASPTVPGAPSITSVVPGDHNVVVAFSPPVSDGGSPIFNFKATCISSDGGATRSASYFSSPIRVSATEDHTYTCTVMAQNRVGFGPPSAPSASVVVGPTLPGAPTITSVTPENHNVDVAFTAPASDGGSNIFNYKVTCTSSDGGATRSASYFRSPIRVGVTSGDTYTCTVMAQNQAGFGPPSAPSAPVVVGPIVPGAPTITSVTAGLESVAVTYSPPAPNGAVNIFEYKAVCFSSNGGVTQWQRGSTSPIVVGHLTGGDLYTCTVMAKNDVGYGPPSGVSSPVTTVAEPTAPGAPVITSVSPGRQSVSVGFSPPTNDGGAAVTNYEATCFSNNGGVTGTRDQSTSPIVVGDLTSGDTYTCIVLARNSAGFGPPSAASAPVTTPV